MPTFVGVQLYASLSCAFEHGSEVIVVFLFGFSKNQDVVDYDGNAIETFVCLTHTSLELVLS